MQDQERDEANRIEIEGGLQVKCCLKNMADNKVGVDDSIVKSDGTNDCINSKLGNVEPDVMCCGGNIGELKTLLEDEPGDGVLNDKHCPMVESLGGSIEEGLKKVSLDVIAMDAKDSEFAHHGDDNENDISSESECESETETSSSSSSNESDSDEEGNEKEKEDKENKEKVQSCNFMTKNSEQSVDVEDGEIIPSDAERMISCSDNDDNDKEEKDDEPSEDFEVGDVNDDDLVIVGPVMSKNELVDLPPVPLVNVTLEQCHQILPVGVILSILGPQVIVEGSEKHNPLSEGSILWISEKRLPLGLVDEIFGPVKTPYYIVRHNSEAEVPAGIEIGTLVGFVQEYVDHVLNDKSLYQKGYDASGENDEEVLGEVEFSDDEKEAEYKRMTKMSKRGNNIDNNQGSGGKRKNKRNPKSGDSKTWTEDQPSTHPVQSMLPSQPSNRNETTMSASLPSSSSQGIQSGPSSNVPILPGIPNRATTFPEQAGIQSLPSSNLSVLPVIPNGATAFPEQAQVVVGMLPNGMPFQHLNSGFPSSFQINSMPWILQQNSLNSMQMPSMSHIQWQPQQVVTQLPLSNVASPQPQFNHNQLIHGNSVVNFSSGMPYSPWQGVLGPNLAANQAPMFYPSPSAHLSAYQGMQLNGPQAWQNYNIQPATNFPQNMGTRPRFEGSSSDARPPNRGRRSFHQRGEGGGFRGGRGHRHFK